MVPTDVIILPFGKADNPSLELFILVQINKSETTGTPSIIKTAKIAIRSGILVCCTMQPVNLRKNPHTCPLSPPH